MPKSHVEIFRYIQLMNWLHILRTMLVLCLAVTTLHGQRYSFLSSSQLEQLASYKTIEDKKGNLWMGTQTGVYMFDGNTITSYNESNGLNSFFNSDVDFDSNNNLWISSYGKGIVSYNGTDFSYYNTTTNFPADNIWESLITDNNYYWGATQDHGLVHWRPGTIPTIVEWKKREFKKIQALALDTENNVWFGGESGLFKINPVNMSIVQLLDSTNFVRDIWMDSTSTLILTKNKLIEYSNHQFHEFPNIYSPDYSFREVFKTTYGTIYITNKDFTTVISPKGEIKTWTISNGLPANFVKDIFEDRHGFLWFCTESGISILPSENSLYSIKVCDYNDEITDFYIESDTSLYMGFQNSGLYYVNNNVCQLVPGSEARIVSILPSDEDIQVVGENHVATINKGNITGSIPIKRPVLNTINHAEPAGNGELLLSCQDGIHVFNSKTGAYSLLDTSLTFYAMHTFKDNKNNRWHLGLNGELYSSNPKNIIDYEEKLNPQHHSNVVGYYSPYYDLYFFGSTGGLFIWNRKNIYPIHQILNINDGVYSITEDDNHIVWFGGLKTLLGLDIQQWKHYIYSQKDGITAKINLHTLKNYNRKIYWASQNEIIIFDHEAAQRNKSKSNVNSIDISYIGYQNKVYYSQNFYPTNIKNLHLQHDENNLNITLKSLNFYSNQIEYHYTLQGLEKYYNTSKNPEITYTNLSPGSYTLKIYTTIDGIRTSETLELKIFIERPYWNKVWFYIVEVLIVLTILGLTYYLSRKNSRISQIMIYFTIIMTFETLIFIISQRVDRFTGNIPVFQLAMNILLAAVLLPVEQKIKIIISKVLKKKLP